MCYRNWPSNLYSAQLALFELSPPMTLPLAQLQEQSVVSAPPRRPRLNANTASATSPAEPHGFSRSTNATMAAFLRGKQTGISNDLSASIIPELFAPDDQARYGINSQIR
jgi:hypothetical protein